MPNLERPIWKIEPDVVGQLDTRTTAKLADTRAGNGNGKVSVKEVDGFIKQQRAIIGPYCGDRFDGPKEIRDAYYQIDSARRLKNVLKEPEPSTIAAAAAKVGGLLGEAFNFLINPFIRNMT